jgi:protein gp37
LFYTLGTRVSFFFKQWGGVFKSRTGRVLDGQTWNQMPTTQAAKQSSHFVLLR